MSGQILTVYFGVIFVQKVLKTFESLRLKQERAESGRNGTTWTCFFMF